MNLFELSETARRIEFAIFTAASENDGDVTDLTDVLDDCDKNETDLKSKIDAICRLIGYYDAQQNALEIEIERLKKRAARKNKTSKSLREWMLYCMQTNGYKKYSTDTHDVIIAESPGSLEIDCPECDIPEQYKTYESVCKIDKNAIKNAIKNGDESAMKFARIEKKNILQIR